MFVCGRYLLFMQTRVDIVMGKYVYSKHFYLTFCSISAAGGGGPRIRTPPEPPIGQSVRFMQIRALWTDEGGQGVAAVSRPPLDLEPLGLKT